MTVNDANWFPIGNDMVFTNIAGPIAANGGTATVEITMTIDPNTTVQSITNYAEIKQAHNEQGVVQDDADSTPDTNPGNDKVVAEDDHDPATVIICTFDLALVKTVSTTQAMPISVGDDVTFTLTVDIE